MEYTITPPRGLVRLNLAEIWRFRELLYTFVWRDIKVRYKQTVIGVAWAIFQPFFTMLIFTVFFGHLAKVPSENTPYPIFVYVGLLFWNYFAAALNAITNIFVENENMIKKIYFPRIILPLSSTITPLVDFVFAFLVLLALMAYYHFTPSWIGVVTMPLLLLMAFLTVLGAGLFLSSLNVKYRDVRYLLSFFIQILLFLTPVIYPPTLVPAQLQWLLYLNPMTGVITMARSTLLHNTFADWSLFGISVAVSIVLVLAGIAYFRKTEQYFADIV